MTGVNATTNGWIYLILCCCILVLRADDRANPKPKNSSMSTSSANSTNQVDALRAKTELDVSSLLEHTAESSAASIAADLMSSQLQKRLEKLYANTHTAECRATIAQHLGHFVNALALEVSLPFTDVRFPNKCGETIYSWDNLPEGMHIGDVQNRTYQPPRNESVYLDDPAEMQLLYAILTHDNPDATIRLIEALYETQQNHQFVVHVDAKYDKTQKALLDFAATRNYVHVLSDQYRVRVNWGGFSMVNATLQTLKHAFAVPGQSNNTVGPLPFHKFVHLSSSSYPLASNPEIRHKLASYPLDANFLNVILQPVKPTNYVWHYFVECDDALHRIYQLPPLSTASHGADLYTSSQWFILSRDFAWYLAESAPNSFVDQYLRYIEHVVVADETFFGTVLRHTEFCHHHHNTNFLHLQFDRWESELPATARDPRKCPMPDPDHCGRSPTIMTLDYVDILELSEDLFARKFDDAVDKDVKEVVDRWRGKRRRAIEEERVHPNDAKTTTMLNFEGHGTLIVAKSTVNSSVPLCLAIPETGNKVSLLPCFEEWVPPTLADQWETGAVVLRETVPHTRWEVGPCTSDGEIVLDNGVMKVTLGEYSKTGPRCMLQQKDGLRAGRCFDGGTTSFQPGGETQVFPCMREWFQFVSFGDGHTAPVGSLFSTIPHHIVKQIRNLGHDQLPFMCLGVYERGNEDELDWDDENYKAVQEERRARHLINREESADGTYADLTEWEGSEIITTQCTNEGGVIEWVFVPFIDEEDNSDEELATNATAAPTGKENDAEL